MTADSSFDGRGRELRSSEKARERAVVRVAERELARGPASTTETRQWLRATATSFGLGSPTVENLLLVASELLVNAFLHASGPFSVVLEIEPDMLRVGVRDRSLTLPVLKPFDEFAATGRGLRIVAASAASWGVDLHVDGKTVWADIELPDLGASATAGPESFFSAGEASHLGGRSERAKGRVGASQSSTSSTGSMTEPRIDGRGTSAHTGLEAHPAGAAHALRRIWYLNVPVADFVAMRSRIEATLRESTLIVLGGARDVPPALHELAETATTRFLGVARAEASASPSPVRLHGGGERGDFAVDFPYGACAQLRAFGAVVRELNGWCESSHLLVDPLTPEMLALHAWAVEQACNQLELGSEPESYGA